MEQEEFQRRVAAFRLGYSKKLSKLMCEPNPEPAAIFAKLEALLLTASTIANGMSQNTCDFSEAHVTEATQAMRDVLIETFGIGEIANDAQ